MDVILLERIGQLGNMGEVVKVKDGYARNFLFPQHKALRATDANKAKFERDRATLEAKSEERRKAAMGDSGKLEGKSFVILRQAGESGQLYGSVSTRDIAEAASASAGVPVSRNHVLLDTPIKTIGLYTVQIALHPELSVPVTLNVARSQDEADAQSRGEVLTGPVSERAEALAAAEELFESEAAAQAALGQPEEQEEK
jgi:large subunit ribosomal protein L9